MVEIIDACLVSSMASLIYRGLWTSSVPAGNDDNFAGRHDGTLEMVNLCWDFEPSPGRMTARLKRCGQRPLIRTSAPKVARLQAAQFQPSLIAFTRVNEWPL